MCFCVSSPDKERISRTSVAVEDETAAQILGYHTTLVTTLKFEHLPAKISKAGTLHYCSRG
ncbi:MAG: hypothetical protein JNM09_12665 [Blastocatellia bacterium]|nr:hypothetical protein [Blastocatellia bacterium]